MWGPWTLWTRVQKSARTLLFWVWTTECQKHGLPPAGKPTPGNAGIRRGSRGRLDPVRHQRRRTTRPPSSVFPSADDPTATRPVIPPSFRTSASTARLASSAVPCQRRHSARLPIPVSPNADDPMTALPGIPPSPRTPPNTARPANNTVHRYRRHTNRLPISVSQGADDRGTTHPVTSSPPDPRPNAACRAGNTVHRYRRRTARLSIPVSPEADDPLNTLPTHEPRLRTINNQPENQIPNLSHPNTPGSLRFFDTNRLANMGSPRKAIQRRPTQPAKVCSSGPPFSVGSTATKKPTQPSQRQSANPKAVQRPKDHRVTPFKSRPFRIRENLREVRNIEDPNMRATLEKIMQPVIPSAAQRRPEVTASQHTRHEIKNLARKASVPFHNLSVIPTRPRPTDLFRKAAVQQSIPDPVMNTTSEELIEEVVNVPVKTPTAPQITMIVETASDSDPVPMDTQDVPPAPIKPGILAKWKPTSEDPFYGLERIKMGTGKKSRYYRAGITIKVFFKPEKRQAIFKCGNRFKIVPID